MEINPYQSPQQDPARPAEEEVPRLSTGKRVTTLLLSLLVVPAAAIAGFGTCTGGAAAGAWVSAPLPGVVLVTCLALGFAVAFGLLVLADRRIARRDGRQSPNWGGAYLGMAIATPLAVVAAIMLFDVVYPLSAPQQGAPMLLGKLLFVLPGLIAMFIWCAGLWIGLRFPARRGRKVAGMP
jgi:hypothetical protein